ncbi:unnamed protein product, partial [Effrenium voratum]
AEADLDWEEENRDPAPGEEGRVEVEKAEEETRRWHELVKDLEDVAVSNLTFAVPIKSRNRDVVIQAVAECYSRYRAAGLQVLRVHTDRASSAFRTWAAECGLWRTVTAGDEPQANGRCESEVGVIKNRTRVLLEATKTPKEQWPLALRHAAEARWRSQLRALGVPMISLVPFGSKAMVNVKRWRKQHKDWPHKGYYVECEDGCFVRASAVVVTVSEQVVKEEQQVRRRLRGKQPDPARVAGGELGDGAVDEAVIPGRVAKIAEMIVGVAKSPISRAPNAGVGWLTPLSREDEGYENLKEWEEELVNWHGHLKRVWYEEKELLGGEAMESWQLEW